MKPTHRLEHLVTDVLLDCPLCRHNGPNPECDFCAGRGVIKTQYVTGAMLTRNLLDLLFRLMRKMVPLALMFLFGYLIGRFQ